MNIEPKIICYYLPQFHETDINNRMWGNGFTEWTNVVQAQPRFYGHYQPQLPRDLGFCDLSNIETIKKQIKLAKSKGITGFCFYYYWFDPERVLDRPLNLFLSSDIDFKFCLCWANENWTRRWDGGDNEVYLKQEYADGFEERFIKSIKEIVLDKRYIKVNSKPLIQIYRPLLFKDPAISLYKIKKAAKNCGIGEIELNVVDTLIGAENAQKMGADSITEFLPHTYLIPEHYVEYNKLPKFNVDNYYGTLVDIRKCIKTSLDKWNDNKVLIKRYRGIVPGWDNTARRKNDGVVFVGNTPKLFQIWLEYLIAYSREHEYPFIFINAWNEWGEGCHLEPDLRNKTAYLDACLAAFQQRLDSKKLHNEVIDEIDRTYLPWENACDNSKIEPNLITYKCFIKNRLQRHPQILKFIRFIKNFTR